MFVSFSFFHFEMFKVSHSFKLIQCKRPSRSLSILPYRSSPPSNLLRLILNLYDTFDLKTLCSGLDNDYDDKINGKCSAAVIASYTFVVKFRSNGANYLESLHFRLAQ